MSEKSILPKGFVKLSRSERIQSFGIDCVSELVWKNWSIGGEYKKRLILRNLHEKVQIIQYELPKTQYFYMSFPLPIKLSPGVSKAIEISFRPIEYERYEDFLKIKVFESINRFRRVKKGDGCVEKKKKFFIQVKAVLPRLKYRFPKKLDFEFCCVHETSNRILLFKNEGDLSFDYQFFSVSPFSFEPCRGRIEKYETSRVKLSFSPSSAKPYLGKIRIKLRYEENERAKEHVFDFLVSGIGKFVHFGVKTSRVSFGTLDSGSSKTSPFIFENRCLASCPYQVYISNPSSPFRIVSNRNSHSSPRNYVEGVLKSQGQKTIQIEYTPRCPNQKDCGELVLVRGSFDNKFKKKEQVFLFGECVGPQIELSTNHVDFGDFNLMARNEISDFEDDEEFDVKNTKIGRSHIKKIIRLRNWNKRIKGYFQFFGIKKYRKSSSPLSNTASTYRQNVNEIFCVSEISGEIHPHQEIEVSLYFVPYYPINYYKRVFVYLTDNSRRCLQEFDLTGSGFDDINNKRPKPFNFSDVQVFKRRMDLGLHLKSPTDLVALRNKKAALFEKTLSREEEDDIPSSISPNDQVAFSREEKRLRNLFFLENQKFRASTKADFFKRKELFCLLDRHFFNFTQAGQVHSIELYNNTNNTLLVYPKFSLCHNKFKKKFLHVIDEEGRSDPPFEIRKKEILPLKVKFLIQSMKGFSSLNFCESLEFYAFYKSQRTFRLVDKKKLNFVPPFLVRMECHFNLGGLVYGGGRDNEGEGNEGLSQLGSTLGVLKPKFEFAPEKELIFYNNRKQSFQSFSIFNHSETNINFVIKRVPSTDSELGEEVFSFEPQNGFINSKRHFNVLCKFNYESAKLQKSRKKKYFLKLRIVVNNLESEFEEYNLIAHFETPVLRIKNLKPNLPFLFFSPSFSFQKKKKTRQSAGVSGRKKGFLNRKKLVLYNKGKTKLYYRVIVRSNEDLIRIIDSDSEEGTPAKTSRLLNPKEQKEVYVIFEPNEERKRFVLKDCLSVLYSSKYKSLFSNNNNNNAICESQEIRIGVIGDCLKFEKGIKVVPSSLMLDFSKVYLNQKKEMVFHVFNSHPCSIYFDISRASPPSSPSFTFEPKRGKIFGRNHKKIKVVYSPKRKEKVEEKLCLKLFNEEDSPNNSSEFSLCVRGESILNLLKVKNCYHSRSSKFFHWFHSGVEDSRSLKSEDYFLKLDFGDNFIEEPEPTESSESQKRSSRRVIYFEFEKKKNFNFEFFYQEELKRSGEADTNYKTCSTVLKEKKQVLMDQKLFLTGKEKLEKAMVKSRLFQVIPKSGNFEKVQVIKFVYFPQFIFGKKKEKHFLSLLLLINNRQKFIIRLDARTIRKMSIPKNLKKNYQLILRRATPPAAPVHASSSLIKSQPNEEDVSSKDLNLLQKKIREIKKEDSLLYFLNKDLINFSKYNAVFLKSMRLSFYPFRKRDREEVTIPIDRFRYPANKKESRRRIIYVTVENKFFKNIFNRSEKYRNPFYLKYRRKQSAARRNKEQPNKEEDGICLLNREKGERKEERGSVRVYFNLQNVLFLRFMVVGEQRNRSDRFEFDFMYNDTRIRRYRLRFVSSSPSSTSPQGASPNGPPSESTGLPPLSPFPWRTPGLPPQSNLNYRLNDAKGGKSSVSSCLKMNFDVLHFDLGFFEVEKKLLVLRNESPSSKYYYEFFSDDCESSLFGFQVDPSRGVLKPQSKKAVTVSVRSCSQVYNVDEVCLFSFPLHCVILNYSDYLRRERRKKKYFESLKEQSTRIRQDGSGLEGGFRKVKNVKKRLECQIRISRKEEKKRFDPIIKKLKIQMLNKEVEQYAGQRGTQTEKKKWKRTTQNINAKEAVFKILQEEINRIVAKKKSKWEKSGTKGQRFFQEFRRKKRKKEKKKEKNLNLMEWILNQTITNILNCRI